VLGRVGRPRAGVGHRLRAVEAPPAGLVGVALGERPPGVGRQPGLDCPGPLGPGGVGEQPPNSPSAARAWAGETRTDERRHKTGARPGRLCPPYRPRRRKES
jgi:hypothetical protein